MNLEGEKTCLHQIKVGGVVRYVDGSDPDFREYSQKLPKKVVEKRICGIPVNDFVGRRIKHVSYGYGNVCCIDGDKFLQVKFDKNPNTAIKILLSSFERGAFTICLDSSEKAPNEDPAPLVKMLLELGIQQMFAEAVFYGLKRLKNGSEHRDCQFTETFKKINPNFKYERIGFVNQTHFLNYLEENGFIMRVNGIKKTKYRVV